MDECAGSPSPALAKRRTSCSSPETRGDDIDGCQKCTQMVACGRGHLRDCPDARGDGLEGKERSPEIEHFRVSATSTTDATYLECRIFRVLHSPGCNLMAVH